MTTTCLDKTVELILAQQSYLRCVARRLATCESDVDDLVQETLLKAFRARRRFRPGTSIRAWTATILRHQFLTGASRTRRRRLQTDTDSGGTLAGAVGRTSTRDDPTPDVETFGDGLDDSVKRALGRIPEIYRESFFLSVVRDLSCHEIAHQLHVPVGTVMSRVHRARERLRGELLRRLHRPGSHTA